MCCFRFMILALRILYLDFFSTAQVSYFDAAIIYYLKELIVSEYVNFGNQANCIEKNLELSESTPTEGLECKSDGPLLTIFGIITIFSFMVRTYVYIYGI